MFSDTFLHVPIALHNYDSPMQIHRPIYLKKDIQVDFFFSLSLLPVLISQSFGYREIRFYWEDADS